MKKRIAISVGHYRKQKGAKNKWLGISEWQVCSIIGWGLDNRFYNQHYEVLFIEDNMLTDKVKRINEFNPSVAIELHMNAINTEVSGHTCLYYEHSENGFQLARGICDLLIHNRTLNLIEIKNTKQRGGYFICKTKCPTVIIELGFIDNLTDCMETVSLIDSIVYKLYSAIRVIIEGDE